MFEHDARTVQPNSDDVPVWLQELFRPGLSFEINWNWISKGLYISDNEGN